jgi:hypothetical protein
LLSFVIGLTGPLYSAEANFEAPTTAYGRPDLHGYWFIRTQTPMERPEALGEKRSYTESEAQAIEAAALEAEAERNLPLNPDRPPPPIGAVIGQEADINFAPELSTKIARVNGEYRTSRIISPSNGRLPFLDGARDHYQQWLDDGHQEFDGPEIRPFGERCISWGSQLPVISPPFGNLQIVQTEDHVVLFGEFGVTQIVKLDGERMPSNIKKWAGDSIGKWDGDSLEVHTTNFKAENSYRRIPSTDALEIAEVYTLVSENELLYRFTFTDPNIYSEPIIVEVPLVRMPEGDRFYEAVCHEGNYSLPGILAGARRKEVDAEVRD